MSIHEPNDIADGADFMSYAVADRAAGLLHGDVIMLCTNGLTDVADDAQSANTLRSHGKPSDQSRAPVDLAINSGARDDVTAVIAHYRIKA
ncbi:MAG: hypothetical protein ABW318_17505 [Vicinamibacterales bacterium]